MASRSSPCRSLSAAAVAQIFNGAILVRMSSRKSASVQFFVAPLRINWRVAVACMAVLVVVFALLAIPIAPATSANRLRTTVQPQVIMWGLWLLLLPLVVAASRRAHEWGVTTPRGLAIHIVCGVLLALLHGVLWGLIRWYVSPDANRNLQRMTAGIVSFVYGGNLLRYAVLVCVYHAFAYRAEARDREIAQERLATHLAQARLGALEARLHPHFLFNTLNTITALIRKDPPSAIRVVEDLGDILRACLRAEPGLEVSLATELELLEKYIAIQSLRFSDRLEVIVRADPNTLNARVPQMILQPFVENAIIHGIAPREAPGTLTVASSRIDRLLTLTVRDDGVGFDQTPTSTRRHAKTDSGIGISNSRARLEEMYGSQFSLEVVAVRPTGTQVTITLPFDDGAV